MPPRPGHDFDSLPLSAELRVDDVCRRFEAVWKTGEPPRIKDFLAESAGAERLILLRELILLDVCYRRGLNEAACPEEYRERFPEVDIDLAAGSFTAGSCRPTPVDLRAGSGDRSTSDPAAVGPATLAFAGSFDDYDQLELIGRGGMGVVYRARQIRLNRTVALKMIRAGEYARAADLERFRTEAEVVARIRHPNIVQIYEVGEHQGQPFLSLEYVEGGNLHGKLHGAPLPPRVAARLTELLARGMQAAHEQAVLHRDLKPANVFLLPAREESSVPIADGDGKVTHYVPKIGDFGLAKKLDEPSGAPGTSAIGEGALTQTGAIVGTPSYMAPEQARGATKEIGPAADIYALGAILYELLTGRPPFKAATALDTALQVIHDEPAPVRQLQSKTPRDLETICLKCLQKSPHRRYATALALAEDLRCFSAGEPIAAQPVGPLERGWRWGRRNPILAVASLTVAVTAVAAFLLVMASRNEAVHPAEQATRLAKDMVELADREKIQRFQVSLQAAQLLQQRGHSLCEQGESGQGLLWLARSLEQASRIQEAGLEGELLQAANDLEYALRVDMALWAREIHSLRAVLAHEAPVRAVAFTPDSRLILTGGAGFGVRVWDAATGAAVGEALPHPGNVHAIAVSADGATVLTAGGERGRGEARLWNLADRRLLHPPIVSNFPFLAAALSPDGRTILTGGQNKQAQLWDAVTGQPRGNPLIHSAAVAAVAFSRDGASFATGCGGVGGYSRRWNTATRQPIGPANSQSGVSSVAFHPDGKALLTGGADQTGRFWDLVSGRRLPCLELHHHGQLSATVFSPDGSRALLAGLDHRARLWDLSNRTPVGPSLTQGNAIFAAAVSPNGKYILTAGLDRTARLWQMAPGLQYKRLPPVPGTVWAAVYSPNGSTIAAASQPGFVFFWDAVTGKIRWPPLQRRQAVCALSFSPDSRRLFVAGEIDGLVRQWDPTTGREAGPSLKAGPVKSLVWSPSGKILLTGSWTNDGQSRLAPREARQWNPSTGKALEPPLPFAGDVWAASFSPDGKVIVVSGTHPSVRFWEAATGQPLGEPLVHPPGARVHAAVFSPDGALVLTGGTDRVARLWDATTRQPSGKSLAHPAEVRAAVFSPDGKLILTGCRDGFSRLWDCQTRQPVGPPLRQDGIVQKVAFAPDGQRFLTAGNGVRQWMLPPMITGEAAQVRDWAESITGLILDSNDAIDVLNPGEWRKRRDRSPAFGGSGERKKVP